MRPLLGWLAVAMLVVDAVGLALVELFYLPLHVPRSLGGWSLPISVLLALVSTPLLVRAAARVSPEPAAAVAPLVAWLLTIIPLGVAGPGGDRVLPADWRALLLLVAGLASGGVAVGRSMVSGYLPVERGTEVDSG
jgi:hypothetical protein